MKKLELRFADGVFTVITLMVTYSLTLWIQDLYASLTLVPMIFVLAVFLVSFQTEGYFWGMIATLTSVLAVNYAFTYPYFAIDLISPECVFSAAVMLIVSMATCTLTTRIKVQEKIKAEIAKERMRANLLRAVSHDLRTPLTTIYGSTGAIIDNYDALTRQQQLKLLGEVREDAQWLIRMVENLLSVTRIDEGRVRISKTPAVLEELIDAVLVKFRKRCPEQPVELELPEEFITIPMDIMLMEQVLLNILENAVDHAMGMTRLTLTVRCLGNQAEFTVSDNGCGIPGDRLKDLFTGYLERETPSDGTRHNMGIGLSVCAAIVRAHGSELFAKNNPEGGASFTFCLEMEDTYEQQQI